MGLGRRACGLCSHRPDPRVTPSRCFLSPCSSPHPQHIPSSSLLPTQSDLVVKFAKTNSLGHANELSKADFRCMVKTLNVKVAGEAANNEAVWAKQVNALFDTLDPDNSGYLDLAEATAALSSLKETAATAKDTRDRKARAAAAMRRKAERAVKRALVKAGERGSRESDDGSPPVSPSRSMGSPDGYDSPQTGRSSMAPGSPGREMDSGRSTVMGGLFSFRGTPEARRAEEVQTDAPDSERSPPPSLLSPTTRSLHLSSAPRPRPQQRKKDAKKRAQIAMQRFPQKLLGRGWNGWLEAAEERKYVMSLLARGTGSMMHREQFRGFARWKEHYQELLLRLARRNVIEKSLRRVMHRAKAKGIISWKGVSLVSTLLRACGGS